MVKTVPGEELLSKPLWAAWLGSLIQQALETTP
jgi:hypothetical protein